jgi:hypothetical protein
VKKQNSKKLTIAKFIRFVKKELGFIKPYKVYLVTERDESMKTYAFYNPENFDVKVYIKNRGLGDILRSIAHEFVHHKQNEDGRLEFPVQDVGGDIEDEANARAGSLVKKFGYENPELKIYE